MHVFCLQWWLLCHSHCLCSHPCFIFDSLIKSLPFLPHSWSLSHLPCSCVWYGSHQWHTFCSLHIDYCNSVYNYVPKSQLNRLQHIQNALTRAVVAAPRSSNPAVFSDPCTGSRYTNALNRKLFSPHNKISSVFSTLSAWSHHSRAFSFHSIIYIGHALPTTGWLQS